VANRVFFADEDTARAAGYRPCAVCLPDRYRSWRDRDHGRNEVTPSDVVVSEATRVSDRLVSVSVAGRPGGSDEETSR